MTRKLLKVFLAVVREMTRGLLEVFQWRGGELQVPAQSLTRVLAYRKSPVTSHQARMLTKYPAAMAGAHFKCDMKV